MSRIRGVPPSRSGWRSSSRWISASYISGLSRTFYLIDFGADPQYAATVTRLIRSDLLTIQKTPPTEAQLNRARGALIRSLVLSETSYGTIANAYLGRSRLKLPLDEAAAAAHAYSRLTAEQVSAAMARWVRPQDFAEIVQGPAAVSGTGASSSTSK